MAHKKAHPEKQIFPKPQAVSVAVSSALLFFAFSAQAADLNIAQSPLIIKSSSAPNVMYIHDDSASMSNYYMPDEILGLAIKNITNLVYPTAPQPALANSWYRPKQVTWHGLNLIYYNPDATYPPPVSADGVTPLPNSTFSSAWKDGFFTGQGTVDLTNGYWAQVSSGLLKRARKECDTSKAPTDPCYVDEHLPKGRAYYHVLNTANPGCIVAADDGKEWLLPDPVTTWTIKLYREACFTRQEVLPAEEQNFANWYSYYRSRDLMAKSAVSRSFVGIGSEIRLGYGVINSEGDRTIDGESYKNTLLKGVRSFEGAERGNFYKWLVKVEAIENGMTPLRRALDITGQYYQDATDNGPWSASPGGSSGNAATHNACRRSFALMVTDGYWTDHIYADRVNGVWTTKSGLAGSTDVKGENIDGNSAPTIDSQTVYTPDAPFKDGYSDTLADVAMYYWSRDLRPDLGNKITATEANPAFWQHMQTMTIGMGLGSTDLISIEDAFAAITDPSVAATLTPWPEPTNESINNVYDLVHAGVNGHGAAALANNPEELVDALQKLLQSIVSSSGDAPAMTYSGARLTDGTLAFQTMFGSDEGWYGDVSALEYDKNSKSFTPKWKASEKLPAHDSRNIWTTLPTPVPGGTPVQFKYGNLSSAQQASLDSNPTIAANILNWVRGDVAKEQRNGGTFRNRLFDINNTSTEVLLGDIVNSFALSVGPTNYGYGSFMDIADSERASYRSRLASATFKNRKRAVYVGANDGMLHSFDATNGKELFAFVPRTVIGGLKNLASPYYSHQYFVDSTPKVADAYLNGGWRTILIGSTGAGGRSYFALDVDNPDNPSVLWEFTDDNLGVAIGEASIVKLEESGEWVAIFGNGYNNASASKTAKLLVVNLLTGALIDVIDTGAGSAAMPNGLATPVAIDANQNGLVDLVYAGDYQGNMWKFDFTTGNGKVSLGGKPLFIAKDSNDVIQPITAKPAVRNNPEDGLMVYFGTGKFMLEGDQADLSVQTMYGIRDMCGQEVSSLTCVAELERASLQEQTIEAELESETFKDENGVESSYPVRSTSATELGTDKKGFYLDLISPVINGEQGERILSTPSLVFSDRIIFTTFIPSGDSCESGGDSWLMALDPFSGANMDKVIFDFNKDGEFDKGDTTGKFTFGDGTNKPPSGTKIGMSRGDVTFTQDNEGNNAVGELGISPDPYQVGRQSWRQIR